MLRRCLCLCGLAALLALTLEPNEVQATHTRAHLGQQIRDSSRISLATVHSSGVRDSANARQNIVDTAKGLRARRSSYGTAPGGSVYLDVRMLRGLVTLSSSWTFRVSEIAGGSHSSGSRHYSGIAADIDVIGGRPVNSSNPYYRAFMNRARALGATEVLGPGSAGHSTHVHIAWPR